MEEERNINITQTEAEALDEVLAYLKETNFKGFEEYVEIELRDFDEKLLTLNFKEN